MSRTILSVAGARPNFMKIAPVHDALQSDANFRSRIVHTGQHYDEEMSDVFFRDLGLPEPHVHLGVGSGSHAEQTAAVMVAFERVLEDEDPDAVLVALDPEAVARRVDRVMDDGGGPHRVPPLWDGEAAVRIAEILQRDLGG